MRFSCHALSLQCFLVSVSHCHIVQPGNYWKATYGGERVHHGLLPAWETAGSLTSVNQILFELREEGGGG